MDLPRGAPGRQREALVLALGLVSAALLVVAALAPFSDPELAGRAAFAQLAGRVEDGVAGEWGRLLAERTVPGRPLGQWTVAEAAAAKELPGEVAPLEIAPSLTAFDVLLGEARRLEATGDAEQALATVQDALGKEAPAARRALGRLVAIRTARRREDCAVAREQWAQAREELGGAEAADGLPTLVACALAAGPCLDDDARAEAQERVVELWTAGEIAAGDGALRDVLAGRVEALVPASEAAGRLRTYERLHGLAVLAATLPHHELPARPADSSWHFVPFATIDQALAWRAEGSDSVVAEFVTRPDLQAELTARVERNALLPAGFRIDFGGPREPEGDAVRERRELSEGLVSFTLRHTDPQAAMRAEGGRLRLLRIALLAVAALTFGASFATFRALRRERRLAAMKSAFVASVSHELRTPLASILMLSENLEAGRVEDEAGRARYHGLIRREAQRLRRLVADVLDFSRLERGKALELRRETLEVEALVASLREEALGWAQRAGFELALEIERGPGRVEVDPDALRRALVNLLENARKHSGEPRATLELRARPAALAIAVRDEGRGVPESARASLFEPFARPEAAGSAPGTGLGLAIVREIAREHGGEVTLAAGAGGGGARFELRLPLVQTGPEEVTV